MNPEEVVQQVAQALAQGADPNQIAEQLMQEIKDPNVVKQIMDAAMQMAQGGAEGGQGMNGTMNTQREGQGMIETALGELGPDVLFALLQAYESLSQGNKQALMSQLQQMSNGEKQQAGGAPANPQEQEASAVQSNLFGGRS